MTNREGGSAPQEFESLDERNARIVREYGILDDVRQTFSALPSLVKDFEPDAAWLFLQDEPDENFPYSYGDYLERKYQGDGDKAAKMLELSWPEKIHEYNSICDEIHRLLKVIKAHPYFEAQNPGATLKGLLSAYEDLDALIQRSAQESAEREEKVA